MTDNEAGHPKVKEFAEEVWETHKRKNSDYSEAGHDDDGDVFSNFNHSERVDVPPMQGLFVRLTDKYDRACNLLVKMQRGGSHAVEDEGVEDALLDLAGYSAIAYAMYMDEKDET